MSELEKILPELQKNLTIYSLDLLYAAAIFVVGKWLAGKLSNLVTALLIRTKFDETLTKFLANLTYAVLFIFVVVAALSKLGIETASFIAVLGAAGFAVGLALQGSLSNFAAGILILIFRPFKVGDVVTIAGTTGRVEEIQIFNTLLCSGDNIRYFVPNSQATSGVITNITAHPTRRIDLTVGVSYSDDLKKAREVLTNILVSDLDVLKDPAPVVAVGELGESSVNFYVRPWVKTEVYWDARFRIIEKIKEEFDRNGLTIPFPQREMHVLHTQSPFEKK